MGVPASGTSLNEILGELRSEAELAVGASTEVTIDGHGGKAFDVALAAGAHPPCANADGVVTPLFRPADGAQMQYPGLGGNRPSKVRVILLDIGSDPVWIVIEAPKGTDLASFVDQAMPIVESMRFGP